MVELREIIQEVIAERGLKIVDVAAGAKYSGAFVYDLLAGTRRFNEENEKRICDFLGISKTYSKN